MPSLKEFADLDDSELPTLLQKKMGAEFPIEEDPPAGSDEDQATATDDELLDAAREAAEEAGEEIPEDVMARPQDASDAGPVPEDAS